MSCRGGSLCWRSKNAAAVAVPVVHARRPGGGPARTHAEAEAEAGTAMEMDERVPRTTCLGMWCPCRAVSVCGWSPPRRHATHHWRTKISYLMITSGHENDAAVVSAGPMRPTLEQLQPFHYVNGLGIYQNA
jgi:hypothetical protein